MSINTLTLLSMLIWSASGALKSYNDRGVEALRCVRYADAERFFIAGLREAEKRGPSNPAVAISLVNIAWVYVYRDRCAEAEPLLKRALAINDGLQNPDRRELATNLNMLGIAYYRQGKFAKAEPLLKRALATIEIACGAERSERVILTDNLAGLYRDTGAWKKAERLYRCELAISEQAPASCPRKLAIILNDIGRVCFEQGKLVEAEALYRRALSMNEQAWKRDLASLRQMFGPNNPRVVTPGVGDLYIAPNLINLAKLYAKQGKYDEAEPLCKRALAIEEKECGFERGQAVNVYALIMRKTNRDSAAVEVEARYKAFQASCGTPKAP